MAPADGRSLREAMLAEQVKAYFRNSTPALATGFLGVSTLLAVALAGDVDPRRLLGWLTGMYLIALLRISVNRRFGRQDPEAVDARRWARIAVAGATVAGLGWGVAVLVLFVPGAVPDQLLLLMVIGSMGAGALMALSPIMPAFRAYLSLSLLPAMLPLLAVADRFHVVMALLVLLYYVALSFFAQSAHATLLESLRLRFEHLALLQEMTKKKEEAELANRSKSRFLAAASHDLRQPLHALGLFVAALEEREPDLRAAPLMGHIRTALQALGGLLDSLLDISRLDAGVVAPRITDFELQPLFDRLAVEFQPQVAAKGLRLRVRRTGAVLASDPLMVEGIVRNLLGNAVRYTPRGAILLAARRRGDRVCLEVRDSGVGIPAVHQQDIFEEFFQIENPERDRGKGLGLGLAIVRRLAQLLGATLALRSEPGRGSVFRVTLPRAVGGAGARPVPGAAIGDFEGARVMVIDDDEAVLLATVALLEGWGCRVWAATSIEEARGLVQEGATPEVLVADHRLRAGTTGLQAIGDIGRLCGRRLPALLLTGDTAADRLQAVQAGGYLVLHKPIAPAKLKAALRHLVGPEDPGGAVAVRANPSG